eukprot:5041907-Ditylum_brightwellii.AAC.1
MGDKDFSNVKEKRCQMYLALDSLNNQKRIRPSDESMTQTLSTISAPWNQQCHNNDCDYNNNTFSDC